MMDSAGFARTVDAAPARKLRRVREFGMGVMISRAAVASLVIARAAVLLAAALQHLAHLPRERSRSKRLLQELVFAVEHAAVHYRAVRVAGHEQHLHQRAQAAQFPRQRMTAFLRHYHVG